MILAISDMQFISKLGSPLAIYLFKSTLFQWPRCGSTPHQRGEPEFEKRGFSAEWKLCLISSSLPVSPSVTTYQSFVQFLMFRQCCVFESSFWSELSVNGDFPRPAKPPDRKKQVQRLKGGSANSRLASHLLRPTPLCWYIRSRFQNMFTRFWLFRVLYVLIICALGG